jgi:hypothetical protein
VAVSATRRHGFVGSNYPSKGKQVKLCRNGHERTEANAYHHGDGRTQCRQCRAEARKRRDAQQGNERRTSTERQLDAGEWRRLRARVADSEESGETLSEIAAAFRVGVDRVTEVWREAEVDGRRGVA